MAHSFYLFINLLKVSSEFNIYGCPSHWSIFTNICLNLYLQISLFNRAERIAIVMLWFANCNFTLKNKRLFQAGLSGIPAYQLNERTSVMSNQHCPANCLDGSHKKKQKAGKRVGLFTRLCVVCLTVERFKLDAHIQPVIWQWHFIYIALFSSTKVDQCNFQQRNNKKTVENKNEFIYNRLLHKGRSLNLT